MERRNAHSLQSGGGAAVQKSKKEGKRSDLICEGGEGGGGIGCTQKKMEVFLSSFISLSEVTENREVRTRNLINCPCLPARRSSPS